MVSMTKKRVIAYFMHDSELKAAKTRMNKVESETESYLLGEIDESTIPQLQEQGLIVQELKDSEEVKMLESKIKTFSRTHPPVLKRASFGISDLQIGESNTQLFLIQLVGPLIEEWRTQIDQIPVILLEYIPLYHYSARLTSTQLLALKSLSFVKSVQIYQEKNTSAFSFAENIEPPLSVTPPIQGLKIITYDLRVRNEKDLDDVLSWLRKQCVSIAGASDRKIRFYLLENSPIIDQVGALPEVVSIEEYVPPKLHNDVARILLGIDKASNVITESNILENGEGQIVAVADTGIDEFHPDFQGRIDGIVALGRQNDHSDPHGHGTHVAGSILGDGNASGGKIRGIAPKARLFFQSLLDAEGNLGGLPLNLADLFKEAYNAGARIHNNSWGAATRSEYTFNSIEVDEFVASYRDMLVVISAGNDGQATNCLHSEKGFTDWLSIGSPASSKNALTIGASRSSRTDGGYAQQTYGTIWPSVFPDPPIANESISGNPEGLAAFSSRGPCTDRRIKPDLVAPGTDILSTKSSKAPLRNFWGPCLNNQYYAFMGGTSMAGPIAAGCAALVREYYMTSRNHQPSAALLKATLINSTKWLTAPDATADHKLIPNYHQGFGCIHIPWAYPNSSEPMMKLEFLDTWRDTSLQFKRTGQAFKINFSLLDQSWLRICLVWTDVPGRALQNNLNLFVQHIDSRQKWMGNENLPMSLKIPDPDNNVEIFRLENPPVGEYLIQISASNLLQTPQDFALVITGKLTSFNIN
jgi:serine protease AprX